MTQKFIIFMGIWIIFGSIIIGGAGSALAASDFASYTGDLTNSTAIIVWSTKYCNWSDTHPPTPPTHIAKDGDPKHTAECNKTYDIANNIISNGLNQEAEDIHKQGKHCEKISTTIEEFRSCMGV